MKRIRMAMEAVAECFGLDLEGIGVRTIEVAKSHRIFNVTGKYRDAHAKETVKFHAKVVFTIDFSECKVTRHESWTI